jgi:DNA repair exonuclease SbcCD ATPase subunit
MRLSGDQYEVFLSETKAAKRSLLSQHDALLFQAQEAGDAALAADQAVELVNAAAIATQEQVRGLIGELVSLALSSVYGEQYRFRLSYEIKRGRSEARCEILKGDYVLSPRECGVGVVNMISYALRLVIWSISEPKTVPLFIFDEPFRCVGRDQSVLVSEVVQTISKLLGVQKVIVTHDPNLAERADRVWVVDQSSGISEVSEVRTEEK